MTASNSPQPQPESHKAQPWNGILEDYIFHDFVISAELSNISLDLLREEVKIIENRYPEGGINASHRGGYHSPRFLYAPNLKPQHLQWPTPEFKKLESTTIDFANMVLEKANYSPVPVNKSSSWFMRNKQGDYNEKHVHGRADLIAVFYIDVPENSGELCLINNNGKSYTTLTHTDECYLVSIMESRVYLFPGHLWHSVEANLNAKDRISVSFNLYLESMWEEEDTIEAAAS